MPYARFAKIRKKLLPLYINVIFFVIINILN